MKQQQGGIMEDLVKPVASRQNGGDVEEEELDPRVQEELEKLNHCTDEINRLEIQLDDANTVFRSLLSDSTHHLKVQIFISYQYSFDSYTFLII